MIVYNYLIADILNNAQVLSLYRANSLLNQGNDSIVDDTAVGSEDESLLKKYLKAGSALVANVLSGYTKDLLNSEGDTVLMEGVPFEFDVTYSEVDHQIVFRINMPETWPADAMLLADEAIKDALENYILYRANKFKMIDYRTYQEDHETALGNLRTYIHRRTETITRSYKLF